MTALSELMELEAVEYSRHKMSMFHILDMAANGEGKDKQKFCEGMMDAVNGVEKKVNDAAAFNKAFGSGF